MSKRLFDMVVSAALLIAAVPVMAVAAIGIALTSPGPIFYRAERMGRGERPFAMYKFRTMRVRAETGSEITGPNDARIFPFGHLLRLTKIDELPQLWNVLVGDMSIVGPRPESVAIVRQCYNGWMKETLAVRPGITSPGAIFGYTHGDVYLDDADPEGSYADRLLAPKLAIERAYLDRASLAGDIAVIFRTVVAVLCFVFGRRRFALPREAASATRWYDFAETGGGAL